MHVPEIIEIKAHFDRMLRNGLVTGWELPYEHLLTRRSAAIFFFTPAGESALEEVSGALKQYAQFHCRKNDEQKLSKLDYQVTFGETPAT